MTSPKSPTVLQRSIAFELKRIRVALGMSQDRAAELTDYTRGAINHLEGRNRTPQRRMVMALLRAYEREDLTEWFDTQLRLMRRKHWWTELPADDPALPGFDQFIGLEAGATRIDVWQNSVVTGLLQTRDYASHLVAAGAVRTPEHIEKWVAVRMQRQEILTREHSPPELWVVTPEWALANPVAPPGVMRSQLDHLLDVARLENVQLQLIPGSQGVSRGTRGSFTILDFDQPSDPGVVYVETEARAIWFEAPGDVDAHRNVMNHHRAAALGLEESASRIEQLRKEIEP